MNFTRPLIQNNQEQYLYPCHSCSPLIQSCRPSTHAELWSLKFHEKKLQSWLWLNLWNQVWIRSDKVTNQTVTFTFQIGEVSKQSLYILRHNIYSAMIHVMSGPDWLLSAHLGVPLIRLFFVILCHLRILLRLAFRVRFGLASGQSADVHLGTRSLELR